MDKFVSDVKRFLPFLYTTSIVFTFTGDANNVYYKFHSFYLLCFRSLVEALFKAFLTEVLAYMTWKILMWRGEVELEHKFKSNFDLSCIHVVCIYITKLCTTSLPPNFHSVVASLELLLLYLIGKFLISWLLNGCSRLRRSARRQRSRCPRPPPPPPFAHRQFLRNPSAGARAQESNQRAGSPLPQSSLREPPFTQHLQRNLEIPRPNLEDHAVRQLSKILEEPVAGNPSTPPTRQENPPSNPVPTSPPCPAANPSGDGSSEKSLWVTLESRTRRGTVYNAVQMNKTLNTVKPVLTSEESIAGVSAGDGKFQIPTLASKPTESQPIAKLECKTRLGTVYNVVHLNKKGNEDKTTEKSRATENRTKRQQTGNDNTRKRNQSVRKVDENSTIRKLCESSSSSAEKTLSFGF